MGQVAQQNESETQPVLGNYIGGQWVTTERLLTGSIQPRGWSQVMYAKQGVTR